MDVENGMFHAVFTINMNISTVNVIQMIILIWFWQILMMNLFNGTKLYNLFQHVNDMLTISYIIFKVNQDGMH